MAQVWDSAPPLEIVPARMINEVLFCERLLYLEWVQSEFQDNEFTVEGRFTHRRADVPTGDLPPAADTVATDGGNGVDPAGDGAGPGRLEQRPYVAKSVWLSSEHLGISAKIDIVEGDPDGRVVPIEYKRGHAPDVPEGAWLPERAQLCAQVLLLREHGYRCDSAEIYFAGDRRRVPIVIDGELERITLHAAHRARELSARGEIPAPLVDSPKCPGCSLVGICLPDEVNLLRQGDGTDTPAVEDAEREIRRLYPVRDETLPVYVQEHGAIVGKKGDVIEVRKNRVVLGEAPLLKVSHIAVFANAQVTAGAQKELASRGIPVCHFSGGGWFYAITHGMPSRNVELRLRQFEAARDPSTALDFARRFVEGKVRNCRTLLRRNAREDVAPALRDLRSSAVNALSAASAGSLLGIEGNAARTYFERFNAMISPERRGTAGAFDFDGRNRRPPRDPINALLSFVYALLVKDLTIACLVVGFDPYLGFYHRPRHGKPALALDLAEEFRPLLGDSVVVNVVNNGEVDAKDFIRRAGSCAMTPDGRKKVLRAYERRVDTLVTHPLFGYSLSYRRVFEVQARLLARVLSGEVGEYPPFRTR